MDGSGGSEERGVGMVLLELEPVLVGARVGAGVKKEDEVNEVEVATETDVELGGLGMMEM